MAEKKVIAVVGATGAEGGGLARAILADTSGQFTCRALTRKPESAAARALADQGAEIVQADLDDEATLRAAFDGAHGAYCLTYFWERFSAEVEVDRAANLARAVKAAGVQHAIWSTWEDVRDWFPLDDARMPTVQGRYKVPFFDARAEGNRYFAESGVPTTYLLTTYQWEAFFTRGAPRRGPDGVLSIAVPLGDKRLPGIAAEDIGRCAYAIFKRGKALSGQQIGLSSEQLTGMEMAAAMSSALGEQVRYTPIPLDVFRNLPVPGIELGANMFQFMAEANEDYCSHRDPAVARSLHPGLQTFAGWLAENAARIPIPAAVG
jgi:uncharacterized protein YbjT (DUF2867 family)